jgi:hypothetical protein
MLSDSFAKIGVVKSMLGCDGMEVQLIGFPDILWRVTVVVSRPSYVGRGACSLHGFRSRRLPR